MIKITHINSNREKIKHWWTTQYLFEITVPGHIWNTTSEGQSCTALKMKCKPGKSYIRNSMATSHHTFEFVVIKSTYTSILFKKRTAAIQKWERNKSPIWVLGLSKLLHHRTFQSHCVQWWLCDYAHFHWH